MEAEPLESGTRRAHPRGWVVRLDGLLTQERLRVYPVLLIVMSVLALTGTTALRFAGVAADPPLPDFLAYWTGGRAVIEGATTHLYDPAHQSALQVAETGTSRLAWFVSPPYVGLLFAPLGALPYAVAAALWLASMLACLALGLQGLRPWAPSRWVERPRRIVLVILASYTTFEAVGSGQPSPLTFMALVAAIGLIGGGRQLLGGVVLAVVLVKPQLAIMVPVALVVLRRWRALAAFAAGGVVCAVGSFLLGGAAVLREWLSALSSDLYVEQVQSGQAWKMASLPALVRSVLPPMAAAEVVAWTVSVVVLVVGCVVLARRRDDEPWVWAVALAVTVVASPHLVVYDALLMVPLALLALERVPSARVRVLVAACVVVPWFSPVLSPLSRAMWPVSALAAPWMALLFAALLILVIRRAPADAAARNRRAD